MPSAAERRAYIRRYYLGRDAVAEVVAALGRIVVPEGIRCSFVGERGSLIFVG